ncbi:MAG: class I mannose-6-phosphate isomerase [Eubacteriales bacterium]|nr:class I mannose-6-phosphate isomerase [Eubacteriales bacterium]
MSFMFHPYPYLDHRAVNPVACADAERAVFGTLEVAKAIAREIKAGKRRVAIDGYAGAPFETLRHALTQQLGGETVRLIDARTLLKTDLDAVVAPCLPTDREMDPVLLYGVRYDGGYDGLQDQERVTALWKALQTDDICVVIGQGALAKPLQQAYDLKIWMDITPRQAALNFKYGKATNLGCAEALPYAAMMRRNYYVDFEVAIDLRWQLLRAGTIDLYVSADDPDAMMMLDFPALTELFDTLRRKPFRCRPVYLEGVWGGFYFKRLRKLPEEMRNCAWVFDMIPLEVSLVAVVAGREIEVPFFTFVQQQGEKLLGKETMEKFGGYFPVRFNYDDTYHANGNMSIQCHPGEDYVVQNHHELGRQDESYYVCITGQGAKTFLGFQEEGSCDAFLTAAKRAEKTGELIDYEKYLNYVPSKPGTQVMIPSGTIHASGRNQVILEIGSLTVGSYTYKLYDYQRIDPQTGMPRPIHLKAGEKVLHPEYTHDWVERNLVNHGGVVRQGEGWKEIVVGEHDLLYFSLRNLVFDKQIEDDTKGTFHVLTLVDGEKVRVESLRDPSRGFEALSMDILVVPADFGPYRIINQGLGVVTVHKTLLKENC